MKYVGNYKDWIKPEWLEYMANNDGEKHPKLDPAEYGKVNSVAKLRECGYDVDNSIFWHSFEPTTLPFDITPPLVVDGKVDWWFVKMKSGNFIPFHRDHAPRNECDGLTARRFWMPLQDYVEGHVFIMENELVKDYKMGDVFEYADDGRHGVFNLSMGVTRYTFNFNFYA